MSDKVPCDCGHESDDPKDCEDCKRRFCPECYEKHNLHVATDKDGETVKAQLFETLSWFCPNCGHQNSLKLNRQDPDEALDLTDEEEAKLREHLGLEVWEDLPSMEDLGGALINVPYTVTCAHCKLVFGTLMPPALSGDLDLTSEEEEDEDDGQYPDPDGSFGG